MHAIRHFWPLLIMLGSSFVFAVHASAECPYEWLPGEGLPGLDNTVYAAAVHDDGTGPALFVGGRFSIAGDVIAENIAKWDGTQWEPLGSGTSSNVNALTVYNGELIAGGNFTTAGGMEANYIAR